MSQSKRFGLVFTLAALGLAISAHPAQGQTMSFFRQFRDPRISGPVAIAADTSGIYVISNRPACHAGVRCRADVSKYDDRGNELWTREFTAPALPGTAVDATGLYVIGRNWDYYPLSFSTSSWIRKYSTGGDELWTRELAFSPSGLAVDATGVYVGLTPPYSRPFYLTKYSSDGAELWSRFDDSPGSFGVAGVAADGTGVYVLRENWAHSGPGEGPGSVVRKWDTGGNELWTRELNPSEFPRSLAAADSGFYVLGHRRTGMFVSKYDSSGDELWSRMIDLVDPPYDFSGIVAADTTGVYLAGEMPVGYAPWRPFTVLREQCRSGSGGDSFVRKYDPDGAEVWTRQFGTSQATRAVGVALDSSGVYAVGEVRADAFRYEWELAPAEILERVEWSGFLARFEKSPAVITNSGPRIFPDCVVNAASYVGGGVAPGEMVTIFGTGIGPSESVQQRLTENGTLATNLADTRVLFDGLPAPLVSVSDKQSTAIVPYAVAGRSSVDVQVDYNGVRSEAISVPVLASRPGIFSQDGSGWGQAKILNKDGSFNSSSNPAERGSVITLYATGGGETAPDVQDGQILSDVLPQTSLPVWVFFDLGNNEHLVQARQGEVLYAGGVPGSVAGLLQIKVRIPFNVVDTGDAVPFFLMIGSHWTVYQVTVALR